MKNEQPIIIIKRPRRHHEGHHGGAWKVAYADFVTAMMAFFLVMWILGLSQDTRKSIAAYFNDPSGIVKGRAGGKIPTLSSQDSTTGRPSIMPSRAALAKAKAEKEAIKNAVDQLRKVIQADPRFKSLKKYVDITVTSEGLRIELLESDEAHFFKTGSAQMQGKTVDLLGMIGQKVAKLENNIIIEGHTDSRPYAGGLAGYSNWELSGDRANSARRALSSTVRSGQVSEIRGYADSRLRTPSDPTHFSNRRISILVAYSHQLDGYRSEEIGPDNIGDITPSPPTIASDGASKQESH